MNEETNEMTTDEIEIDLNKLKEEDIIERKGSTIYDQYQLFICIKEDEINVEDKNLFIEIKIIQSKNYK